MSAVRVNEAKVLATQQGAEWWLSFRRAHPPSRFTEVVVSIGGNLVDVACDDYAHAEWLAYEMVRNGIPRTAVSVEAQR